MKQLSTKITLRMSDSEIYFLKSLPAKNVAEVKERILFLIKENNQPRQRPTIDQFFLTELFVKVVKMNENDWNDIQEYNRFCFDIENGES